MSAAIAGHDLEDAATGHFGNIAKFHVFEDQRPDIVTESVGVEFTSLFFFCF